MMSSVLKVLRMKCQHLVHGSTSKNSCRINDKLAGDVLQELNTWIWDHRWNEGKFSSIQFSRSVLSDSLQPHESQHARPPCPSPTPRVHPDLCPSSQWCHPAISSSVVSFCPQSLPAPESFPMSQLFAWSGQSTGVSALASFLPKYEGKGKDILDS